MKNIQPISIWDNGTVQEASVLNTYVINDNLSTSATFYYTLLSESMQQLAQGNLTMSGDDYDAWETNDYAYDWVAGQLNLTIIGDYVPPTTSTTTTLEPTTTTSTTTEDVAID
jgi:hypothetical protein